MARPRTPSNVLDMRGAFRKNPRRKRSDAKGSQPFNRSPPKHLPQETISAWNFLVERLPTVTLYNCDEIAVEMAATLLARFWIRSSLDDAKELRLWLGKLGMNPLDRARLEAAEPPSPKDPADNYF